MKTTFFIAMIRIIGYCPDYFSAANKGSNIELELTKTCCNAVSDGIQRVPVVFRCVKIHDSQ